MVIATKSKELVAVPLKENRATVTKMEPAGARIEDKGTKRPQKEFAFATHQTW